MPNGFQAAGLHPFGALVLLAGAFLPIADFFIVAVALPRSSARSTRRPLA
jgi:hypothetical protein